jgi:hypothetical protein
MSDNALDLAGSSSTFPVTYNLQEVRMPGLETDKMQGGNKPRTISARLLVGIIFLPFIFAWFLLRKGYSINARVIGLGWMTVISLPALLMEHPTETKVASDSEPAFDKIAAVPKALPVIAMPEPATKPVTTGKDETGYIELLDQVLASGRQTGLIRDEGDPQITWGSALGSIGTMAAIYLEGDKYELTDKGKAKQKSYVRELGQMQSRAFPTLRAIYGKALGNRVWEHDVDVKISGPGNRTVRLTGFWFASNRNIKQIFESMQADALALRFSRVEFRSHKLDDTTYYDLEPLPDSQLATFAHNKWTPVE